MFVSKEYIFTRLFCNMEIFQLTKAVMLSSGAKTRLFSAIMWPSQFLGLNILEKFVILFYNAWRGIDQVDTQSGIKKQSSCTCHLIHLTKETTACQFTVNVEDMLVSIFYNLDWWRRSRLCARPWSGRSWNGQKHAACLWDSVFTGWWSSRMH